MTEHTSLSIPLTVGPTVFVGLDVHKETINLAAICDRVWRLERVFSTRDLAPLRKALKSLTKHGSLRVCYEASGAGFWLQRQLTALGVYCEVIAPSLIPVRPGEKKKCDRLDARRLAEYLASGLLTAVRIPTAEEEADRDLVRCRFAFRKDITKAKHRVLKFLARKDRPYFGAAWTKLHVDWLHKQSFELKTDEMTFRHFLDHLGLLEARLAEIDGEILQLSRTPRYLNSVRVLLGFQGVKTLTAMVFLTELGDLKRFSNPRQLMAYLGLVPSVHESANKRRDGSITKAGNSHVRHVLLQAAWNYFKSDRVGRDLRQRQQGLPAWALEQSGRAQKRLKKRLTHLSVTRGKCVAVVAGARELACFLAAAVMTLDEKLKQGVQLPEPPPKIQRPRAEKQKSLTNSTLKPCLVN